jgi:peptidoglycan hydrolase CwlO-like protein
MISKIPLTLTAALALILSASIVFQTVGNSKLQQAGQAKDADIQAVHSEIRSLQQQLQTQQKQIESANQLANQVGPAILSELATLQVKNNNMALGVFLQKHGVQVRNPAPEQVAPTSTKPAKGNN